MVMTSRLPHQGTQGVRCQTAVAAPYKHISNALFKCRQGQPVREALPLRRHRGPVSVDAQPRSASEVLTASPPPQLEDVSSSEELPIVEQEVESQLQSAQVLQPTTKVEEQVAPAGGPVARLLSLAVPLMVQNVVGYASSIINMAYVGNLGATQLSAFVLASSIYNVVGLSVALGLSTGMDTLAGSAFGAREYSKLGLILQRALVVCWGACVPVAIAWLNADALLRVLGQQPEISAISARLLVLWIPCLFLSVLNECMKRFLQAQRLVKPLAVSGLASVLLAPVWFHLTMSVMQLGVDGSALASTLIQATTFVGLLGFNIWRNQQLAGKPEQPWRGLQIKAAASGWREYLQFGLPAAIMICLEWWVFEAVVVMSGWLPDAGVSLACMGICFNLIAWAFMMPMGLAASVNTSVANALGAGDGRLAANTFKTGLALAVGLQALLAAGLVLGAPSLIPLLCQDPAVRSLTISVIPLLSCVMFIDGMNAVVSGVLRGAGRQRLGAIINGCCFTLALPLAWACAFKAGLGVHGFWMGVGAGSSAQLIVLLSILLRAKGGQGDQAAPAGVGAGAQGVSTGKGSKETVTGGAGKQWWSWNWSDEAVRLQGVATMPAH